MAGKLTRGARHPRLNPLRATGAWRAGAFLPHGPGVGAALGRACQAARSRGSGEKAGVAGVAVAFLAAGDGPLPPLLSALGLSAPALSAAIKHRYRQAG